jgi:hypothetical protein
VNILKIITPAAAALVLLTHCALQQLSPFSPILGSSGSTVARALPLEDSATPLYPQQPGFSSAVGAVSLNDTARLLAGMDAVGYGHPIRSMTEWQEHKAKLDQLWGNYGWRHRQPIQYWSRSAAGDLRSAPALFYPFSGPDFLFANEFFPNAETMVLVGLEPCEPLPPLVGLQQADVASGLEGLRTTLNTVMQFSFFITKDMRNDLVGTRFRGVLPVMLVFLARSGHAIDSVDLINLDSAGLPQLAQGSGQGLVLRARDSSGRSRRIFYIRQDLSDGSLRPTSPLLRLVDSLGQPPVFLKSASYLLQQSGFSTVQRYITERSGAILQDSSGLSYADLMKCRSVKLYGNYQGIIDLFSEHEQPDLISAYANRQQPPLRFGIGYLYEPEKTCLMVGRR